MTDQSQLIALYNQYERKEVEYPDLSREVTPDVVRHVAISENGEGMITYSQLTESNVDAVIRQQMEYFESIGQGFEWKVYDYDQPVDLKERLAAYGFTVEEAEALVVLEMDAAPAFLWEPVQPEIRRITDPAQLVDVQTIEETVWNEDSSWVTSYLGNALRNHPELMSVYIAYVDDQPASAAWIHFPKQSPFASLWGGSTISVYRKQGLYTALLAVRAQEAKRRGVKYLTVDASPMSRPILEKFGFRMMAYSYPCRWESNS